jgi:hypothetical protein
VGVAVVPLASDTPAGPTPTGPTPEPAEQTATPAAERPTERAAGPAAGSATPAATTSGELVMEIEAAKDSWLSVRADDETKFEGILRAGGKQRWEARQKVWLHTGNAGATEVTINGRRLDALGKPGEVVKRQWKLLASGDIEQSS